MSLLNEVPAVKPAAFVKADAFLNLELVDKDGNRFRMAKGLPLHVTNKISEYLIAAAAEQPGREFQLVGTVASAASEQGTPNL